MTLWRSTRDDSAAGVGTAEAVTGGLAADGGLYVPASIPMMTPGEWAGLSGRTLPDVATALIAPLVQDAFSYDRLGQLMAGALSFDIPLVRLERGLFVLELFHGPTLAFKDVGARTMARWMAELHGSGGPPLTVLVATSGDTGGAVADAFYGVPGTRVFVLYPLGRVSKVQEAQFATLGLNVTAVAVEGTFDECQRLVKAAFADRALAAEHRLTSANSINVGRLLPQMAYYAWAVQQLPASAPPPVVVVPSGNLGNLTAGVMAQRRGVPIAHFVAATTVNDPFPRYLAYGAYEPHAAVPTLANAMDVGNPSNFERMAWLFGNDVRRMRTSVSGVVATDLEIRKAMREMKEQFGYVADPHTAVGYLGARHGQRRLSSAAPVVILGTAHPAKFPEVVEPTLGAAAPLPASLAARMAMPGQAGLIGPNLDELARALRHGF